MQRLRTEQADLSLQLDKVQDKIATGAPGRRPRARGTAVIQQATEASGSLNAGAAAYLGTLWRPGSAPSWSPVVLLVTARRDPRVRLRDEIADAIGSPVPGGGAEPPATVGRRAGSTLLDTYEATAGGVVGLPTDPAWLWYTPIDNAAARALPRKLSPSAIAYRGVALQVTDGASPLVHSSPRSPPRTAS